jgi:hypothetical protein
LAVFTFASFSFKAWREERGRRRRRRRGIDSYSMIL